MSRESVLARGRAAALVSMTDACVVRRKTSSTEGPGGVMDETWADIFTGQCRVQVASRTEGGSNADVGEAALVLTSHEIQLPIAADGILEGDQIEITAAVNDPDLIGRTYVVRTVLTKSEATSRRVSAIEVTS